MQENKKIDIIIPVFNGLEFLPRLFESLFRGTTIPYRLILVDDCSSDEKVYPFLKKIKAENSDKDIVLLKNDTNSGFVKTVNRAFKEAQNHFVLINTDIEVPAGWLERIIYPIISLENIASATPFTNSGTICSFPKLAKDNEILMGLDVSEIDSYFQKVIAKDNFVEMPTGVGFCMAFNKKVVDEIGMFDEKSFGKGYGEENDWCQRAVKKGYKNVIIPNLFVYHKHGGSFPAEEKKKLIQENFKKLLKKHPRYAKEVASFIKKDPLKNIRDFLVIMISANEEKSGNPVLFFDHELGGGANMYREKLIKEKLEKNGQIFIFTYDYAKKEFHLRYYFKKFKICYSFDSFEQFFDLLEYIKIGTIIISQIVSYENPLDILSKIKNIQKITNARLEILVHDYFSVCPNYVLLNAENTYCGVPDDLGKCLTCMQNSEGEFQKYSENRDVESWRKSWLSLLQMADRIVCFSNASKNIFMKAYPEIKNDKVLVIPHKVDKILFQKSDHKIKIKKNLIIGVLGGINKVKGSEIIKEMAEIIKKDNLPVEIVVIGELVEKKYNNKIKVHGKYKHQDLGKIISKYSIDIFFIPSIWPETFSYTTEEIMQLDYPLAVFDIGAPAERVKRYTKGLVLTKINAKIALNEIINYCKQK
jgi:GT2 family glycosyltransferase